MLKQKWELELVFLPNLNIIWGSCDFGKAGKLLFILRAWSSMFVDVVKFYYKDVFLMSIFVIHLPNCWVAAWFTDMEQ